MPTRDPEASAPATSNPSEPTPEHVRRSLATLDAQRQKIVIGMLGVMIHSPARVREREWMSERLCELTLLSGGFESDEPEASVRAVEEFLKANSNDLLAAALLLFQRVGLDLAPRAAAGFSFEDAMRQGLTYLPVATASGPRPERRRPGPDERDLGEQPLAGRMSDEGLDPKDLVRASDEQLTHRMVTRAMKGRRLTAKAMGKVHRAWNRATGREDAEHELFDYRA